jgi:hypothetical protein
MNGGPSHVDTFDPKPELTKWHGKVLPDENRLSTERKTWGCLSISFYFQETRPIRITRERPVSSCGQACG